MGGIREHGSIRGNNQPGSLPKMLNNRLPMAIRLAICIPINQSCFSGFAPETVIGRPTELLLGLVSIRSQSKGETLSETDLGL